MELLGNLESLFCQSVMKLFNIFIIIGEISLTIAHRIISKSTLPHYNYHITRINRLWDIYGHLYDSVNCILFSPRKQFALKNCSLFRYFIVWYMIIYLTNNITEKIVFFIRSFWQALFFGNRRMTLQVFVLKT